MSGRFATSDDLWKNNPQVFIDFVLRGGDRSYVPSGVWKNLTIYHAPFSYLKWVNGMFSYHDIYYFKDYVEVYYNTDHLWATCSGFPIFNFSDYQSLVTVALSDWPKPWKYLSMITALYHAPKHKEVNND